MGDWEMSRIIDDSCNESQMYERYIDSKIVIAFITSLGKQID